MSVPKLRFKEFDGDWVSANIQSLVDQNILDKPMDGNHGEIHPTSADYVENGIPFVMATDVFDGKVHLNKSKKIRKEQADTLRKGFSIEGDILLTHKATIGNVAKVPELETPYIMLTPQVTYYRILDQEKLLPDFIKCNFESVTFQNELIALCTGATRLYIGISEQRKLPFSYPSKPEQTKIASFLSAVDEKINQLTQKHELLSQYKQGMMQKLFSQQIRFKADDGSVFGEWVFSEIGGVFKFKQGKQVPIEDQNLNMTDTSARFIRIVDLTSRNEPPRYIVDYSKNDLIKKDDLFMVRYGSPGLLGFGYEGVIANNLFRIIPIHPKQVYSKFSYHLFDNLYQQVCQLSSSTTMPAISFASLNTLKVCLPSLEEQTKIANFLSAIDQKIEVAAQQIEQAKQWKKGLLQQMFV